MWCAHLSWLQSSWGHEGVGMGIGKEEQEVWSNGAYSLSRAEGCSARFVMVTMFSCSFVCSMVGRFCASGGPFLALPCVFNKSISVSHLPHGSKSSSLFSLAEKVNSRLLTSKPHTFSASVFTAWSLPTPTADLCLSPLCNCILRLYLPGMQNNGDC